MPSLSANVPAKITISNPKAIKINCWDDSIIYYFINYLEIFQWLNKLELPTFLFKIVFST